MWGADEVIRIGNYWLTFDRGSQMFAPLLAGSLRIAVGWWARPSRTTTLTGIWGREPGRSLQGDRVAD